MQINRLLIIGTIYYFVTLYTGTLVTGIFGIKAEEVTVKDLPINLWLTMMFITVLLSSIFSWTYFKGKNMQPDVISGLLAGMIFIIIGLVFDFILIFFTVGIQGIIDYFANPFFLSAVILVIFSSGIVGKILESK